MTADKVVCTSRPGCLCKVCCAIRLLMAQQEERITRELDERAGEDALCRQYMRAYIQERRRAAQR